METIRVRINDDGVTAREVNSIEPFVGLDKFYGTQHYDLALEKVRTWQQAEAALRSFDISMSESWGRIKGSGIGFFEPDTIHTAEILPNGKIKIID